MSCIVFHLLDFLIKTDFLRRHTLFPTHRRFTCKYDDEAHFPSLKFLFNFPLVLLKNFGRVYLHRPMPKLLCLGLLTCLVRKAMTMYPFFRVSVASNINDDWNVVVHDESCSMSALIGPARRLARRIPKLLRWSYCLVLFHVFFY